MTALDRLRQLCEGLAAQPPTHPNPTPHILCAQHHPTSHTTICDQAAGHDTHQGASHDRRVTWTTEPRPNPATNIRSDQHPSAAGRTPQGDDVTDQPAPETSTLFVPPAARNLPLAALDSATAGADMLDATARTPTGRNLLAHALVQLARDGWLRVEPGEGFEPRGGAPSAATPPQDGLSGPQDGPEVPEAGAEPRGGPSGAETGVQGRETLRQQYAAAIDEVTGGICPGDIIDAALAVHHRDTAQLRRERDMALTAADEARGLNQRITTEAARRGVISIDGIRRIGGVTDQIQEQP